MTRPSPRTMRLGRRLTAAHAVGVLEAAYALDDPDPHAWTRRIVEAASPIFDRGLGTLAMLHERLPDGSLPLLSVAGAGPLPFTVETALGVVEQTPPSMVREMSRRPAWAATASELLGSVHALHHHEVWQSGALEAGIRDNLGCFAVSAHLQLSINALSPDAGRLTRRERWPLVQLATHLQAALRLRDATRSAEAVIRPDGVVLDAERDARPASMREALRERVLAIEWARTKGRRKNDLEALEVWQGLLDGRWSLVEQLEHDGKRFYVARENAVAGVGPNALRPRERQVLALAATGVTNKVVGYTLGISASTVSLHLRAAAGKMGVSTRTELLRLAALSRAASGPSR